jgi:hypothetical protein
MNMEAKQIKFILKLLGCKEYRSPISKIQPNPKTKASERNKICRDLGDFGYVAYSEKVTSFTIAPPGKTVLTLDPQNLPITETELKVLQASSKGTITPGSISNVPATQRQLAITSLIDRRLIKAVKTQIQEVWLTEQGKEYLRDELETGGYQLLYSGEMLNNYIQFLRKSLTANTPQQLPQIDSASPIITSKPSDEEVLQIIRELDRELGTKNYLPIFHLRSKLQPPLSRIELDEVLYRLQRIDRIQLGALQEGVHYNDTQLASGIHREFGGALFFITVN